MSIHGLEHGLNIPTSRLPHFTNWFCTQAMDTLRRQVRDWTSLREDLDALTPQMRALVTSQAGGPSYWFCTRFMLQTALDGARGLNPDCFFHAYPRGGRCLIQPCYTLNGEPPDRLPAYVRPFGYWDNSDPDENVSGAEWRERKRAWTAVLDIHEEYDPKQFQWCCKLTCDFINVKQRVVKPLEMLCIERNGDNKLFWVAYNQAQAEIRRQQEGKS